jgi:hypothetical protein
VQQLLARQQALTNEIDELRRRRGSMPSDQYDSELDRLLTELAAVSAEVRQKTGK